MKPLEQLKQEFYTGALPIFSGIGWELIANHSEVTPSGRGWSSDFIATKGNMRLAIFIMDIQEEDEDLYSDENIQLREAQFDLVNESRVRGLWLYDEDMANLDDRFGDDFRIPLMSLMFTGTRPNTCMMSVGGYFRPQDEEDGYEGILYDHIYFDEFIEDLLVTRKFTWSLKKNDVLLLTPVLMERKCWKCYKPTLVCKEFYYFKQVKSETSEKINTDFIDRLDLTDVPQRHIELFNQNNERSKNNVGEIKVRYSRTVNGRYMSNGCAHCDSLQGAYFTDHSLQPTICDLKLGVSVSVEGDEYKSGHWVQID